MNIVESGVKYHTPPPLDCLFANFKEKKYLFINSYIGYSKSHIPL
jgi:hypothetical protein